jgi:hypothetical protein
MQIMKSSKSSLVDKMIKKVLKKQKTLSTIFTQAAHFSSALVYGPLHPQLDAI